MYKYSFLILTVFLFNCLNAQTTIFSEDFQSGIPLNFSIINNDNAIPAAAVSEYTTAWISIVDPSNTSDSIAASTSYFEPIGIASRWLITPKVKLGSFGNFIEWNARSQDASFSDDYMVLVSRTTPTIAAFEDTIAKLSAEYVDWTNRKVDLSLKGFNNDSVYFAFVNTTNNGFKLYLDDIRVWKEDPAAINEIVNDNQLEIFPNPSTDFVTINSNQSFVSAAIYSLNGALLFNSFSKKINVSQLNNGVYIVVVQTDKGSAPIRFHKF